MTDTLEHDSRETLWVTDAELIKRLGAPRRAVRSALQILDRDLRKGFPQKQKAWGNRRYWPAVKAYFDHGYGLKLDASTTTRRQP